MTTGSSNNNSSAAPVRSPASASSAPTSSMSASVNLVMTTFGFLISAIFIVFVLVRLLCARFQNRRLAIAHGDRNQADVRGAPGMDPLMISLFPTVTFSHNLFVSQEDAMCSVCLGEYEDCDFLRILPHCGHTFHVNCIDAWLRQSTTCPVCRILIQSRSSRRRICCPVLSDNARSRFTPGVIPEELYEQPLSTRRSQIVEAGVCAHFALHVRDAHDFHDYGGAQAHAIEIERKDESRVATNDLTTYCPLQGCLNAYEAISPLDNVTFLSVDQDRSTSTSRCAV